MQNRIYAHLLVLLGIFLLLNASIYWIVSPILNDEIQFNRKEKEKSFVKTFKAIPELGFNLIELRESLKEIENDKVNKNEIVQFTFGILRPLLKDNLEKIILKTYQSLPVKKIAIDEDSFSSWTNEFAKPSVSSNEIQNTILKSSEQLQNPIKDTITNEKYIQLILAQIRDEKIKDINNEFHKHLTKWKPLFDHISIKFKSFNYPVPGIVKNQNDYIGNFEYQLNNKHKINIAFFHIETKNEKSVFLNHQDILQLSIIDPKEKKIKNLNPLISTNLVFNWNDLNQKFQADNGSMILQDNQQKILRMWKWEQANQLGKLAVLDLRYNDALIEELNITILYDFALFTFLILMALWFTFYQSSKKDLRNTTQVNPDELNQLKEKNLYYKQLLLQQSQVEKSKEKTTEQFAKEKPSFLLPKEQSYIDTKIDYQKDIDDIMMNESKTDLLKQLVKRIREE